MWNVYGDQQENAGNTVVLYTTRARAEMDVRHERGRTRSLLSRDIGRRSASQSAAAETGRPRSRM